MKSRDKQLELTDSVVNRSNSTLEKALSGGRHLTREELVNELGRAKIATDENRASHLFLRAELDGIVCSGAAKNGKQTYALLQEWVPKTQSLTKDEALARLAKKYFASHAPAALQDFVWWSGLSLRDARHALELVKSDFSPTEINAQTYWLPPSAAISNADENSGFLLPGYDEFIISYRDRSAVLPYESHTKAVSNNGIFRPVIVVNGQVTGIWKRTLKKNCVIIEPEFFAQSEPALPHWFKKSAEKFGCFVEKATKIVCKS